MPAFWNLMAHHLALIAAAIPALGAVAIFIRARYASQWPLDEGRTSVSAERFREIARGTSVLTLAAVLALIVAAVAAADRTDQSSSSVETPRPASATPRGENRAAATLPTTLPAVSPTRIPMGVDGLSLAFLALTAAVWVPAVFVARSCDQRRPGLLYGLLLLLESAFLGSFAARDGILFCLFLEGSSVLVFLLLNGWGGSDRNRISRRFLLFNLVGDLLVLVAFVGLGVAASRVASAAGGGNQGLSFSFDRLLRELPRLAIEDVGAQEYWKHAQHWILTVLILGLAIKTPLVPFHAWFAPAVADAPLCVGLALLGTGLRVTSYAFARFVEPLAGDLGGQSGILVGLAALGSLHASLLALAHGDMKKMAACASLSQAALMIAGFLSLVPFGATGAVVLAIGGGLGSALLLFGLGFLGTRHDAGNASEFGGISRIFPQTSAVLLVAALSLVGVPGLCGFAGLFPALASVFYVGWTGAFLAMLASLVVAWALFWMMQRVIFGSPRLPQPAWQSSSGQPSAAESKSDLRMADLLIIAPLLAGVIGLGIRPQALVDFVQLWTGLGSYSH